jgi:ATP-dependent DNA helicase RecG
LIAHARTLAERCIAEDPELSNPALADIVLDMEMDAAGDWLERT